MVSINKSFSCDLKDISDITNAEDKAKEKGVSFSQYLVDLIKEDLKKKNDSGILANNYSLLPDKQTTLDLFTVSIEKMKEQINETTDKIILGQLNRKALLCLGMTKNRLRDLR